MFYLCLEIKTSEKANLSQRKEVSYLFQKEKVMRIHAAVFRVFSWFDACFDSWKCYGEQMVLGSNAGFLCIKIILCLLSKLAVKVGLFNFTKILFTLEKSLE